MNDLSGSKAEGKRIDSRSIASDMIMSDFIIRMDQSCSIFGMRGSALLIHFYPSLYVQPATLPAVTTNPNVRQEYSFVIAHTMVTADKHVTAPVCYNLRVVETRLAALVMARALFGDQKDKSGKRWDSCLKLRDVHEWCLESGRVVVDSKTSPVDRSIRALKFLLQSIEDVFKQKEGCNRLEIANLLGMTVLRWHEYSISFSR